MVEIGGMISGTDGTGGDICIKQNGKFNIILFPKYLK